MSDSEYPPITVTVYFEPGRITLEAARDMFETYLTCFKAKDGYLPSLSVAIE